MMFILFHFFLFLPRPLQHTEKIDSWSNDSHYAFDYENRYNASVVMYLHM